MRYLRSSLYSSVICLLCACVADPHHSSAADVPPQKIDPKIVEQKNAQLHLDLIRDMVEKGQDYAALAHIQDLKQHGDNDEQVILVELVD